MHPPQELSNLRNFKLKRFYDGRDAQVHQDATAVMDNEFYRSCREVEDMQIYIHARRVKHFMSFLLRHRISLQHLHYLVLDQSGALSKRTSYNELEQWNEHNIGAALEMEDSRNYTGRAKNLSLARDSMPKKIRIYKLGSTRSDSTLFSEANAQCSPWEAVQGLCKILHCQSGHPPGHMAAGAELSLSPACRSVYEACLCTDPKRTFCLCYNTK